MNRLARSLSIVVLSVLSIFQSVAAADLQSLQGKWTTTTCADDLHIMIYRIAGNFVQRSFVNGLKEWTFDRWSVSAESANAITLSNGDQRREYRFLDKDTFVEQLYYQGRKVFEESINSRCP